MCQIFQAALQQEAPLLKLSLKFERPFHFISKDCEKTEYPFLCHLVKSNTLTLMRRSYFQAKRGAA